MLKDKNIVLGITGGIAVYKAVEVVSRLRKAGANVHVIMSRASTEFVTPLTFREISGNPVTVSMWDKITQWNVEHIALATLADMLLVVPATANIISKAACGMADDMLTTTLLATKAPVFFSPAMNTNMYENSIVQENLAKLKNRGYHIIDPACGHLACGTDGMGRLPEPEAIVQAVMDFFTRQDELRGRKVLITAAGTIEPIDPVRYIGNRSSGKMGYAVAHEALSRGAEVVLVSGPSALSADPRIRLIKIETAAQMQDAVLKEFADSDLVIKAAAVADYRSKDVAANKIKKNDEELVLVLEKNPDILLELGRRKTERQVLVGFAAETQNLLEYAKAKLTKKNLDFIVANDVTEKGAGFNTDTNLIKLLFRDGKVESLPLQSKQQLAKIILDRAQGLLK
ncbi:MAG: bifunctional phosphopantothenoylcysteine decarboxylase/phosphopantothenate--cysteine ligase CoaBC [Selenomonadaceae bacterium]